MKKKILIIGYFTIILGLLVLLNIAVYTYKLQGGHPDMMPIYFIDFVIGPYLVYVAYLALSE